MKKILLGLVFLAVSFGFLVAFTTAWFAAAMMGPTPAEWLGFGAFGLVIFVALALAAAFVLPAQNAFPRALAQSAGVSALALLGFVLAAFLFGSRIAGGVAFYGVFAVAIGSFWGKISGNNSKNLTA